MGSGVVEGLSSQPHRKTLTEEQHSAREEKLKEAVMKLSISSSSSSRFSLPKTTIESFLQTQKLIEAHLPSFFTSMRTTPTHPPYAVMVMEAIKHLNEEGGSNVEAISKYIETNFEGFPWAHSQLLKHHLSKLVDVGEIISSSNSCYLLPNPIPNHNPIPKNEHTIKHHWGKRRRRRRPPKRHVPEEKFVARTDIIGSLSDEDDCLMVLGNSNKCESEGNVVVGTELIRSSCDEDNGLIELGNNNDCEPEGNFVVGTEILRSSCDGNDCSMVLGNSSNCESEGNVVVGTELIRSSCDEDNGLIELGNNNDYEPEGSFVVGTEILRSSRDGNDCSMLLGNSNELEPKEEFLERTEMIGSSLCDEDDSLMQLGNNNEHEPEEEFVERTEFMRSSFDGNDSFMAFGNGNNLESVLEVEPLQKQLPRSPANTCDFEPVHHEESEENCGTVEIEVDPLQQRKRRGELSKKCKSTGSCAVDDNPTVAIGVESLQKQLLRVTPIKNGDPEQVHQQETVEQHRQTVETNPAVGIEVGTLQQLQLFKRRWRPPKKGKTEQVEKSETIRSSCNEDDVMVLGNSMQRTTQALQGVPFLIPPAIAACNDGSEENEEDLDLELKFGLPGYGIAKKTNPDQVHQQEPVEQHPQTVGANPVVRIEGGPLQLQQFKRRGRPPKEHVHRQETVEQHHRTVDANPVVGIELGPLQQQQFKCRGRLPKERVHQQETVEQQHRTVDANPVVGIEVGPLQKQQLKRRGRPPKEHVHQKEIGEQQHRTVDANPVVGIEVGPLQQQQLKRRGRPLKEHVHQKETGEQQHRTVDANPVVGIEVGPLQQQQFKRRGIPPKERVDQQFKCRGRPPKKHVNQQEAVEQHHQTIDAKPVIGPLQQRQFKRRGRPPKKRETEQVERSETIRSCADEDDGLMVLGNSNNLTSVIDVETLQNQPPRTTPAKKGDPQQVHQQETIERHHRTIDVNPAIKIDVGSLQQEQQYKPRGRPPKKHKTELVERSESIQLCADDVPTEDGSMVLPDKHLMVGIEVGSLEQQWPKRQLRPRPPPVPSTDVTKKEPNRSRKTSQTKANHKLSLLNRRV